LTENEEASQKLQKAQSDQAKAVLKLQSLQDDLSQAVSVGDSVGAKKLYRQIQTLQNRIGEYEVALEASQAGVCHAELKKILEAKQEAQKALDAIPEPSTESIVAQEIANAQLTAPLCSTCYLRMVLDKHEMPFIMGSTANWKWLCKGPAKNPHPPSEARQERKLLYPWREALTPESFKAATSNKPTTEPSTTARKTLAEAQIELAERMAPNCPNCGAKMKLDGKEPLSLNPPTYRYRCLGSKATRLHAPATFQTQIPLLKAPSSGVKTTSEGVAVPRIS